MVPQIALFVLANLGQSAMPQEKIEDRGSLRSLGITAQQMKELVFPEEAIPSFSRWRWRSPSSWRTPQGYATVITLNAHGDKATGSIYSEIKRDVYSSKGDGGRISVECRVYEDGAGPVRRLRAVVEGSSAILKHGSITGRTIGDDCWSNIFGPSMASLFFTIGRVYFNVQVASSGEMREGRFVSVDVEPVPLVEALARGLEMNARLHLEIIGNDDALADVYDSTGRKGSAVVLQEHAWATVGTLRTLGVQATSYPGEETITMRAKGKSATFRLFEEAFTLDGARRSLPEPVLLAASEPAVPLRPVLEAFGYTVTKAGRRITVK